MFIIDLACNIFYFCTLNLFISHFTTLKNPKTVKILRGLYFLHIIIYSYVPSIPYNTLLTFFIDGIYLFCITNTTIIKKVKVYALYNIYFYLSSILILALHTILAQDFYIASQNELYFSYKSVICSTMQYILLSMYIITKRISSFPSGKTYKRYFLAIMSISVVLLTVCSMLLGSSILLQEQILPLLFFLLVTVTVLFLAVYRKLVSVLEESALRKIEAEKNVLQQDYYAHVETNLAELSRLRHDFKNHLFALKTYAQENQTEKLLSYIDSLSSTLTPAKLIQTPSPLLSSLLNAKNEDCKAKNVQFSFKQNFSVLKMDDFHLVTIMSNLLDNAITAAAKCADGQVTLCMEQLDSYLEIDCVNNHRETLLPKGDILLTTKPDPKNIHGLGITSMRKTVDSLHGKMSIQYTDTLFHVIITVPNYN